MLLLVTAHFPNLCEWRPTAQQRLMGGRWLQVDDGSTGGSQAPTSSRIPSAHGNLNSHLLLGEPKKDREAINHPFYLFHPQLGHDILPANHFSW